MFSKQSSFLLSIGIAAVWLAISTALAVPWLLDVAQRLPFVYVLGVILGIALLPGYLMTAMFLSNLMHTKCRQPLPSCREPITVLICARNEEASIYETIQQIVIQQYAGSIRILCVDNCSTDQTQAEILRAMDNLSTSQRTIRLLLCPTPGKANALNAGLAEIDTRYFVTVDADTSLSEQALHIIVQRIITSGAGCVAGNLLVKQPQTWVQKMQIYDYLISIAAVKRYQGSYGVTLVAQGAFSAYDTKAVKSLGGWRQGAGEDIVLTYQLLQQGRSSLYEPQAVGYTMTPGTLRDLCRQRARWARGMFEGLAAVKPWQQPTVYGGYFESLNLSIIYLDLAYVFGFLVGVCLCLFGIHWFVGWLTLLMLPVLLISSASVYLFQKRLPAVQPKNSALGLVCFIFCFQTIQSLCSLWGYCQALTKQNIHWK